mmetsp:Transcript_38644/g.82180  ORF Transcript_38644/g.82180 Transcript_38644/m.82180 type:complete len:244 (+) Transcript_38644:366-1097(+)
MISREGSKPKIKAIHSLASFTFAPEGSKMSRCSKLSVSLTTTGFSTRKSMGECSPGTTLRRRGPGIPNPGPSTSSHPGFSTTLSNSTHSPPRGPVQVRPLANTMEPTLRLILIAPSPEGSVPSFLMRLRCRTRYSTASVGSASASTTASKSEGITIANSASSCVMTTSSPRVAGRPTIGSGAREMAKSCREALPVGSSLASDSLSSPIVEPLGRFLRTWRPSCSSIWMMTSINPTGDGDRSGY